MLDAMLDTSVCIRLMRREATALLERFNAAAPSLCISTIVLTELLRGVPRSVEPARSREKVVKLVARLEVLDFDSAAAAHAAEIAATLASRGQTIGPFDTLIAGHARSRALVVVTGNIREFARVDGLRCEDWEAAA